MRLTEKYHGHYCSNENGGVLRLIQKLGQLEDHEEELDVDLITKLKVEAYYMKNFRKDGKFVPVKIYEKSGKELTIDHFWPTAVTVLWPGPEYSLEQFPYKEYGKTLALTKEELL